MNISNHLPRTTIKQWKEAGASLVTMLKDYMDLSLSLTSDSVEGSAKPNDLAAKIDSILEVISNQLLKISSVLARTRNRLVSPLRRLPEETMSIIFMNVIFGFDYSEASYSEASGSLEIEQGVCRIYRRIYSLLGVCSTWRNIIMARGAFWSVIPMVANPSTKKRGPVELSLQRAGGSKLRLVAVVEWPGPPKELAGVLTEYGPRLCAINLNIRDHQVLVDTIDKLLQQGTAGSLTELSVRSTNASNKSYWVPSDKDYVIHLDHPERGSFARLVEALTVFRIHGAHFYWHTMVFSSRLVELQIENITLGHDDSIYPFLRAISSASELRDLKIITVDTFLSPDLTSSMEIPSPVVLPNLQSLHLQDLFFNTLKSLLPMIAPGSHRLTFFIDSVSLQNNLHDDDDFATGELQPVVLMGISDLCGILEGIPIDTLMFNGRWDTEWLTGPMLHDLLKTMPTLKTLKMYKWKFDEDIWNSLKRPQGAQIEHPDRVRSFPALKNLQLGESSILTDEGFQDMVASHPLQRVVLGGTTDISRSGGTKQEPIEENTNVVKWLRDNVPEFSLVDSQYYPPEFQPSRWQLW